MPTHELTLANIFDHHEIHFDPGDQTNGSLYLCRHESQDVAPSGIISALKNVGLWSDASPKQVRDDQRDAYKSQLKLLHTVTYRDKNNTFLLVCCTHPKYPVDQSRWQAWLDQLDTIYSRL